MLKDLQVWMLVICGTPTIDPQKVGKFFKDIAMVAGLARHSEGCIDYQVGMQKENRSQVLLVEKWLDQESMHRHLKNQHMRNVLAKWCGLKRALLTLPAQLIQFPIPELLNPSSLISVVSCRATGVH